MWRVRATMRRIVDGDTFVADLDLGWGVWRLEVAGAPSRIRILGVDTPERTSFDEWLRAADLLASLIPVGTRVWVESQKLDSFGRALCNVYLEDGTNIAERYPAEWRT